jgi:hypothetical protein
LFRRRFSDTQFLATIQNVVRNETDVFRQQNKSDVDVMIDCIAVLDIAIEDFQQFAVYHVEIPADDNSHLVRFHRYNIHDLEEDFVPERLRMASE